MTKQTKILAGVAVTLVALFGVGLFILLGESPVVEDFVGRNVKQVAAWQEENGVQKDLIVYKFEYNEKIDKDIVISQNMPQGEKLKKDPLVLTVSKGFDPNASVDFGSLEGKDRDSIEKLLKDKGFTDISFEYEPNIEIEKEFFIKHNLDSNNAKRNDLILITLSAGDASEGIEIIMPDFKDSSKANIDAWAKTNNVKVLYTYAFADKVEKGKVVTQFPKAQAVIKTGSEIEITVSNGKGVTLKDLVGKPLEDAKTWLQSANVKFELIEVFSEKPKGNVTFLEPKAGSIIAEGATVKVYASAGLVPVTNFVGKTKAELEKWVKDINGKNIATAKISVVYREVSSDKATGTVLKMSFDGSTYVTAQEKEKFAKPGDSITVEVAREKGIVVENKIGSNETDFISYITGLKLKGAKGSDVYSDKAVGRVAKHDTGNDFKEGAVIKYQLSKGIYSPDANSFNGKTPDAVSGIIQNAINEGAVGWSYKTSSELYSDTVAKGNTFECSINGNVVSCKVSLGSRPMISVPAYSTNPCSTSTGCTKDNLNITLSFENHDTVANGAVISQSVASGTQVEANTNVHLVISKGPAVKKATIPSVPIGLYGQSFDEVRNFATKLLNDAGFSNVTFVKLEGDDNPAGIQGYSHSDPAMGTTDVELTRLITVYVFVNQ